MSMAGSRPGAREWLLVGLFALGVAFWAVRLTPRPTFTDSYYHFNAAVRLASGQGLTDAIIWPYLGQPPDAEPPITETPSHLYWMPLTSIVMAGGMALANAPGDFVAAQAPFIPLVAATFVIAYWLGWKLGATRRHALAALLIATPGGYFVNMWGEADTFALYAAIGSGALIAIGLAAERQGRAAPRWWLPAGVLAGLGHLTRSDGLLLLLCGWLVIAWPWRKSPIAERALAFASFTAAYLVVMLPWFARMIDAVGALLPLGGLNTIWLTEYNDLFRYPPVYSPGELFADGLNTFIATRWVAFSSNLGNFIVLEGFAVMMPLMLIGLWRRRGPLTLAMALFALGLHLAMTFVFAFPGYRGGLFHGVAALLPWWAALAPTGLDVAVDWMAARRRRWRPAQAKRLFSVGLCALALLYTATVIRPKQLGETPGVFAALEAALPADARVMLNDPAQLYYFTGIGGAVLPSSPPELIAEIAARYGLTHLLFYDLTLDESGAVVGAPVPDPLWPIFTDPPDFLTPLDFPVANTRLYAITPP